MSTVRAFRRSRRKEDARKQTLCPGSTTERLCERYHRAEPRNGVKREVELGCHSELDCSLPQGSTAGCSDCHCDFVPHSCWQQVAEYTGQVPVVADGLFGLADRSAWDKLFIDYQPTPPPPPHTHTPPPPPFLVNRMWSLWTLRLNNQSIYHRAKQKTTTKKLYHISSVEGTWHVKDCHNRRGGRPAHKS